METITHLVCQILLNLGLNEACHPNGGDLVNVAVDVTILVALLKPTLRQAWFVAVKIATAILRTTAPFLRAAPGRVVLVAMLSLGFVSDVCRRLGRAYRAFRAPPSDRDQGKAKV